MLSSVILTRSSHILEQLYQRLLLEAKGRRDKLNNVVDCFASKLWDENEKLKLDMVSMSYGTVAFSASRMALIYAFYHSGRLCY